MYKYVSLLSILAYPLFSVGASWSEPVAISSVLSDQPNISVDSSGNATLVWQGYDGSNYVIQAAGLPFGGSWSTPQTLSEAGQDAQRPSAAADYAGNIVAVWSRYNGEHSIVQGATLPFQGSWSSVVDISDAGQNADSAHVAMDASGSVSNAVAVWHRFNGSNFIMQSSNLPAGGSWTSPTSISVSGQDALVPVVAVDPNGDAAAVCSRFDGSYFTSRAASYLLGQTWSSSFVLSTPGATAAQQSIGMDGAGNSLIAWSYYNETNNVIQISTFHFGDGWTTPVDISIAGQNAYIPQVAVDNAGNATVLWVAFDDSNYVVQAATKALNGSWTEPVILSQNGGDVANLSVAVNDAGQVFAVWDRTDGTVSIIQAASLVNGSWSTPVDISATDQFAYYPTVGIDASGNAVSAWLQSDGTSDPIVFGAAFSSP